MVKLWVERLSSVASLELERTVAVAEVVDKDKVDVSSKRYLALPTEVLFDQDLAHKQTNNHEY